MSNCHFCSVKVGVVWWGSTCWPFDELISTWCISKCSTLHMGSITCKKVELVVWNSQWVPYLSSGHKIGVGISTCHPREKRNYTTNVLKLNLLVWEGCKVEYASRLLFKIGMSLKVPSFNHNISLHFACLLYAHAKDMQRLKTRREWCIYDK